MSRHVVAGVADVAPGACKLVIAKGREIGMFNVGGKFYALANRCPHKGGPLCHGRITGLAQSRGPGEALVKGPYIAEHFPVSGEENYLVVEI